VPLVGVAREGVARELLSLHRKNYVTAGIVFMLDNYGARARARDRIETALCGEWGAKRAPGGGKKRLAEEKFFGGSVGSSRRPNAIRLMNRNNSRAIVLFGSFQLTVASEPGPASERASAGRAEWRDAGSKVLYRASARRRS